MNLGNGAVRDRLLDELRSSREYLRHLISASPAMIFSADSTPPFRTRFISDNVRTQLGYEPADFTTSPDFWRSHVHPDDLPAAEERCAQLAQVESVQCEYRFRSADGRYRWMRSEAKLLRDSENRPAEIVGCWLDVTDRKAAEDALAARERHFRRLTENASDIITELDLRGVITYLSPAAERIVGFRPEEVIGHDSLEFVHPEDVPAARALFEQGLRSEGRPVRGEFRSLRKNGTWLDVECVSAALQEDHGVIGVVMNARDISERKRMEEARRGELAFRQAIEDSIQAGLTAVDKDGRMTYVNPAFCRMVGYSAEELIGMEPPFPFWAADDSGKLHDALQRSLATNEPPEGGVEGRFQHRNGRAFDALVLLAPLKDASGTPVGFVSSVYDLSEHKRLEDHLRQAQKMEAVGRLAGGVAHDFNNLLTAILGYAELLLELIPQGDPLRSSVEEIRFAGESATSLTRQLLTFSRRQAIKRDVLDVNTVIGNMSNLLRRTIGEHIRLDISLDPAVPHTLADRGQLEQVLVNLAVNARDAMPHGGTVTIRTAARQLVTPVTHGRWTIPPGEYVLLSVSDNGEGMTPEALDHLFEPFFTTKPRGKGTGLGLPTVYGIVMQSGGHIGVESTRGAGTTLFVYLPATAAVAASHERPVPTAAPGSETVLVAEDNPVVRLLVRDVLERYGYRVLVAENGDEALVLARGAPATIDLLLTDVVMPGMSGAELSKRVRALHPQLRCLFTSGYTDDTLLPDGLQRGSFAFLQKPFTPAALLETVRQVLHRST